MWPPIDLSSVGLLSLIALGVGYLFGSIPFGLVLVRAAGLGDLRTVGSGNIGATNVLRTGNKPLAGLTFLLDAGKGAIAAFLGLAIAGPLAGALAGAAAFLGHLYPVWLGFKGGKGVSTFFGLLFAFAWPVGLLSGATWIGMALLFRISSLSALTASALAPVFFFLFGRSDLAVLAIGIGLMIYWRHRENISRLLAGTEPRIGAKKATAENANG